MLESTFLHIQGIGEKTEKRIWARGIRHWRDFLSSEQMVFSPGRDRVICQALNESIEHLDDPGYFSGLLASNQSWRLFEHYKKGAVYLDIETSGLSRDEDEITVIGIYDGKKVQSFVQGDNLEDFEIAIAEYDLVITFNGAMFDLPFIKRSFPSITLPPAHIDLRFVLRKLGYKGGLKKIERQMGVSRGPEIDGLGGYEAVILWRKWLDGDRSALDRLIEYNTADIVNLEPLMETAYKRLKAASLSS